MNVADAKKFLKPGVLIQYTPHGPPHETWFNGVVASDWFRIGSGDDGTMCVTLKDMEPAYAVDTGRPVGHSTVKAAAVDCIRLGHVRCNTHEDAQDARDMLKWRDEAIAVLVEVRKISRKLMEQNPSYCGPSDVWNSHHHRQRDRSGDSKGAPVKRLEVAQKPGYGLPHEHIHGGPRRHVGCDCETVQRARRLSGAGP